MNSLRECAAGWAHGRKHEARLLRLPASPSTEGTHGGGAGEGYRQQGSHRHSFSQHWGSPLSASQSGVRSKAAKATAWGWLSFQTYLSVEHVLTPQHGLGTCPFSFSSFSSPLSLFLLLFILLLFPGKIFPWERLETEE